MNDKRDKNRILLIKRSIDLILWMATNEVRIIKVTHVVHGFLQVKKMKIIFAIKSLLGIQHTNHKNTVVAALISSIVNFTPPLVNLLVFGKDKSTKYRMNVHISLISQRFSGICVKLTGLNCIGIFLKMLTNIFFLVSPIVTNSSFSYQTFQYPNQ